MAGSRMTWAQVGAKLWEFRADAAVYGSPALGADGTIYFGTIGGRLYALKPGGTERWQFLGTGAFQGSAALGADETVYIGSMSGVLYAVNSGGSLRWTWTAGGAISSTPAVGSDGTIYVGSQDRVLTALSPEGKARWQYRTDDVIQASPIVGSDGVVYVASRDGRFHAVKPDGTRKWALKLNPVPESSAAIGQDGRIYFGSTDARLRALNPDGSQAWEFATDTSVTTAPAVAADGTILFLSGAARAYAVSPDGTNLWEALLPTSVGRSSPALGSDGVVYVGGVDGRLYALNPGGTVKWSFLTENRIFWSSPTLGPDATVYVGSEDSKLYALRGSAGPAASPWPMYQRDARHTASGFVDRWLPDAYSPGLALTVTLNTTPAAGVTIYSVEDTPPSGWQIGEIGDGGYFDAANRRIRFGPFFDSAPRRLTYTVTPPLGESGSRQFNGSSSVNGSERLLGGDYVVTQVPLHPADNRPVDGWLTIGEMTSYGAAWKRGAAWPIAPTPIPSVYLTRAVQLWQTGESYRYDTNFSTAPQWWVAAGPAPTNVVPPEPLAPGTAANNGRAVASAPLTYRPGGSFTVAIDVKPATNVLVYAVEDQAPPGWAIDTNATHGAFEPATGKVKWGPFFDATPRTLSYVVVPAANATTNGLFHGVAAFDGVLGEVIGQRSVQPSTSGWPSAVATRRLPSGYSPGATLVVTIQTADLGDLRPVLFVEEAPPTGWTVGAISDNGVYDATQRVVRFGPFTDGAARTLSYELTPPLSETDVEQFYGTFSLDEGFGLVTGDLTLNLIPLHPADLQAADAWLTIGELTAYGAAWKRGTAWPASPSPVPAPFVEQASLLWLSGEAYGCDTNAAPAPFCWFPLPNGATPSTPEPPPVAPGTTATNGVVYADMPVAAAPGTEVAIALTVIPATNVTIYAVEDRPPDGWQVTRVDADGVLDPSRGKVKWGPFFDPTPRTNTYWVRVPSGATNVATFSGVAAFEGRRAAIAGQRQLAILTGETTPVARRQLPVAYLAGAEMVVAIATTVPAGTRYYVIEDSPPAGWGVGQISDHGAFDSQNRKVRFGPFLDDLPRTLTYETTPPAGASGRKFFSGSTLVDDVPGVVIGPHAIDALIPLHPADLQWADSQITVSELTAYGAAWKRGTAWPVPPTAVPAAYLTRAVQLWQSAEWYGYDASVTNAPDWWVSVPNPTATASTVPTGASTTSGTAAVAMPHFYQFDTPITVTLTVTPISSVAVYAVEELVPQGWTVTASQVGTNGFWDAAQHKVKWGPFFDSQARVLSYQATPTAEAGDEALFAGGAAFDGAAEETVGRRQLFRSDGEAAQQFNVTLLSWSPSLGTALKLDGLPGETYVLLRSADLTTWAALATLTNLTGSVTYIDIKATNLPLRYYRGLWP